MSIALLANRFDVLWVMGQVGHADSKMTMDVHPQLQQRVKREHGRAFDRLVDQAREQLYGAVPAALNSLSERSLGHGLAHEGGHRGGRGTSGERSDPGKPAICRKTLEWRDLEPGHHDFSGVLPRRDLQALSAVSAVAGASRFSRNLRPFRGRYGRRRGSSAFRTRRLHGGKSSTEKRVARPHAAPVSAGGDRGPSGVTEGFGRVCCSGATSAARW